MTGTAQRASFSGKAAPAPAEPLTPVLTVVNRSIAELRAALAWESGPAVERAQLAFAEAITVLAVRSYWRRIAPARFQLLPMPAENVYPLDRIPPRAAELATMLGEIAASFPVKDAAYHISFLYTAMLPAEWRSKHGNHYTPPPLAERLLDQAAGAGLDWKKANVLDPAAGAAAFLSPAAQRVLRALKSCAPAIALENVSSRIRGFELDPFAAWLAQVFLEAFMLPLMKEADSRPASMITVCDSLDTENGCNRYDLVIANPPFGRMTLPVHLRERFAESLHGHANLYGVFMHLAIQLARPGGLVSFLTPSSFLAGGYFKNLRSLLSREAPPVAVDFVTPRRGVFEDVLQETVLATYHKGAERVRATVSFLNPQPGLRVAAQAAGKFSLPHNITAPWILPRHADEAKLARRLRHMPTRLEHWGYRVNTGPLVWNRYKGQLRDTRSRNTVPLIWAECVTSDGRFIFRSEKRGHKPYFLLHDEDDWLVVRMPCVLLQRTTAKEQPRRLIAAEMPASFLAEHDGVTVENHLNMLVPTSSRPTVPPAFLAAFLNTITADRAFRCLSGSVAVSAYELENLPVPPAGKLKELVGQRFGRARLNEACARLYAEDADA